MAYELEPISIFHFLFANSITFPITISPIYGVYTERTGLTIINLLVLSTVPTSEE